MEPLCGCVNNVIFENREGENIRFAKYTALCKRGLKPTELSNTNRVNGRIKSRGRYPLISLILFIKNVRKSLHTVCETTRYSETGGLTSVENSKKSLGSMIMCKHLNMDKPHL